MFHVPLYVEGLRSRPLLVLWLAMLAQAALWILVPLLFYSAPPGDLPQVLAIGHEFPRSAAIGPPLAYWVAEVAYRAAGLFGVYVLSQICVICAYWCVFALGRAIVGATAAAMAVLLMAGIVAFTVPTPDFNPAILAAALWAAVLLNYWHAVMEQQRASWYALGVAAALLLLTSELALILIALLALFTATTATGRAALGSREGRIVTALLGLVLLLHLFWLADAGEGLALTLGRLRGAAAAAENTVEWLRLLAVVLLAHAGLAVIVLVAKGWPRSEAVAPTVVAHGPLDPLAVSYVKLFALVPALLATIFAVLAGYRLPIAAEAPLLLLSGLAVVVAAGERIELHHQGMLGLVWAGLLAVPAILVPIAILVLPWTGTVDLNVARPAAAMGRFFAETYERRTGHRLAIVSGDASTAALIALTAPGRPSVYFDADPARSPSITGEAIRQRGAVVVWPAAETTPEPPLAVRTHFPDLVAEVPQTFERPVRGRLPPLRIGWGMVRPASAPAALRR